MAETSQNPEITLAEMTSQTLDAELFRKLLALSRSVFEPGVQEQDLQQSPSYLSTWKEHIERSNSKLIYALDESHQPVGLFFVELEKHTEIGHELPYIWIACVDPNSRGLGIFPRLMDKFKAYAKGLGYREITVITYPEEYTKMYRILSQHGWEEVARPKPVQVLLKLTI